MNSISSTLFPYRHRISFFPGGEIRYTFNPAIPHRSGAKDKKDIKLPAPPAPLGSNSEFHEAKSEIKKFHSKQGQSGYGAFPSRLPRFTQFAKNSIRRSACALEHRFGKERCVFLTGTLPGSTPDAVATFAKWSSWFMDCLQKFLRDNFSIDGELYHCGVWEFQARGALHYHALVATDSPNELILRFSDYWISLLHKLSAHTGIDLFARASGGSWASKMDKIFFDRKTQLHKPLKDICAYAQKIEKSSAAYLSKYIGKENGKYNFDSHGTSNFPPARWWACTRALKNLVQVSTINLPLPPLEESQLESILAFISEACAEWANFSAPMKASIPVLNEDGSISRFEERLVGHIAYIDDPDLAPLIFEIISQKILKDLRGNISDDALYHRCKHSDIFYEARRKYDFECLQSAYDSLEQHTSSSLYCAQWESSRAELRALRYQLDQLYKDS